MVETNKPTKQERLNLMHKKEKIKKEFITISIIIILLIGLYFLMSNSNNNNNFIKSNLLVNSTNLTNSPIHWHPNLKIVIDGKNIQIPNGIGINPGSHSPIHTHDDGDGTIHLENQNPKANPQYMVLGFLFNTWKKPFNSTCVLDKCTNIDGGKLQMFVNGKENFNFENYVFKGEEKVLIKYTSNLVNNK